MRGINDSYFLVLVSESIREELELDDIRESEEYIHLITALYMSTSCHATHTHHIHFKNCHFNLRQEMYQFKSNPIMKNCLCV